MTFSAIDPTIAPAGPAQHHARGRSGTPTSSRPASSGTTSRDREADRDHRPGRGAPRPASASTIEHVHVQTPLDLERELGLRRGNVMHVEMGLDSMFVYRPLPELAGYRTPVRGLYLTGASTHPGGGVFGASGRTAARRRARRAAPMAVRTRRVRRGAAAVGQPTGRAGRPARGCSPRPRSGCRSPTRSSRASGCADVTIAIVVLFFLASVTHAAVHRGLRWAVGLVVVTAGGGLAGRGGRGAHRVPVRRLRLRRHARARRSLDVPVDRAAGLDDDGLPRAPRRPADLTRRWVAAPSARFGLAAWDVFLDPQMVDDGHWRWADPTPGLPGVDGVPLTNFAGWLLVGAA